MFKIPEEEDRETLVQAYKKMMKDSTKCVVGIRCYIIDMAGITSCLQATCWLTIRLLQRWQSIHPLVGSRTRSRRRSQ